MARDMRDFTAAAGFYRRHLKNNPNDFAIWVQLGHSLKEAGYLDDAIEAYGAAFDLNPLDADLLLSLGHISKVRAHPMLAARYYLQSYSLGGDESAKRESDQPEIAQYAMLARDSLRVSSTPQDPRDLLKTGTKEAVWHDMVRYYRGILEIDPEDGGGWAMLGHSLRATNQLPEARTAYLEAIRLRPNDPDLLFSLGYLARLDGAFQKAANYYRQSYGQDRNLLARTELEHERMAGYAVEAEKRAERSAPLLRPLDQPLRPPLAIGSVDFFENWKIGGWVVDPDNPTEPATVSFFNAGKLVGSITADRFRGDIEAFDIGCAIAGFSGEIDIDFSEGKPVEISARLNGSGRSLMGSPFTMSPPAELGHWLARKHHLDGDALAMTKHFWNDRVGGMTLSIVMPVYNTRPEWLREALQSVIDQWSDRWELLCVDDCSTDPATRAVLSEFSKLDPRVKVIRQARNGGISKATNAGIAAASGDYIGFLDHDDYLEPDAVSRMLEAAVATSAELIYSDEATTSESIHRITSIAARPAFSHDYYLSHPYFVHFNCVRADVAKALRGYDEELKISADVDFTLRMIEHASTVTHVPSVLYRWRTHGSSSGHARKDEVTKTTLRIINAHLKRFGYDARASEGPDFNAYRIDFADDGGKILVVIPTKDRHDLVKLCIDSMRKTVDFDQIDLVVIDHDSSDPDSLAYFASISEIATILPYSGPFNYAAINNYAVQKTWSGQPYILFLNNDIEALEPGWIEHMRGLTSRPDVGAVGAGLLYPDRTYQHGGVVMGLGHLVDHAHKLRPYKTPTGERNPGYKSSLIATRDYSAVTAACLMVRAEVFNAVGGFDPDFEVGFNDTDLCLRIGSLGLKILYDGHAILLHHESATRQTTKHMTHPEDARRLAARWAKMLIEGDPFYSPLLKPSPGVDHVPDALHDWSVRVRSRSVKGEIKPLSDGRPEVVGSGVPRYL